MANPWWTQPGSIKTMDDVRNALTDVCTVMEHLRSIIPQIEAVLEQEKEDAYLQGSDDGYYEGFDDGREEGSVE